MSYSPARFLLVLALCAAGVALCLAPPEAAARRFDELVQAVRALEISVATGEFGADMRVEITNDGPVTVLVDSRETRT